MLGKVLLRLASLTLAALALHSASYGVTAASALSTLPGTPQSPTANADDEAAYVGWLAPSSDGGAPIDGYKVVADGVGPTVVAPCGQCTAVYFSGLSNGTSHMFAVYAHTARGYSLVPAVTRSVTPQAPVEPAPTSAQNVSATASGNSATITWSAPTSSGGAPVDRYLVQAFNDTLTVPGTAFPYYAGSVYACGTCTSATVNGLTSGQTYHFVVFSHNSYSYGPAATTGSVAGSDQSCPQGQICLTVDGSTDLGPNAWRADGFLHGVGFQTSTNAQGQTVFAYSGPSPSLIQALKPSFWRTSACTYPGGNGDPAPPTCQWVKASTSAAITDLLSDTYYSQTYNAFAPFSTPSSAAGALPPWECWSCYSQAVQNIATHNATNNDVPASLGVSVAPDYWDVQNEPPGCCTAGYYGANQAGTTSLYLQQYRAAYQALKSAQPNAQVVAPSLGDFTDTPIICDGGDNNCGPGNGSNDPHDLGFDSFLPFAVKNGLSFSAISWHDNSVWFEDTPNVVPDQMAELNSLFGQYGLLPTKAFVNEYGAKETNLIPGWSAGWIAALEKGNVDGAHRSCWPEIDQSGNSYGECGTEACSGATANLTGALAGLVSSPCLGSQVVGGSCSKSTPNPSGTLDGLFSSPCLGSQALQPNGNYWVYRYYAGMNGERVTSDTSDQTLTAFATKNDAAQEMQVLVGRHETCTPAANPFDCSPESKDDIAMLPVPAPAMASITVRYPYTPTSVRVSIAHIPNSSGPVGQPNPVTQMLPVANGMVTIPISAFADGDAYTITITP